MFDSCYWFEGLRTGDSGFLQAKGGFFSIKEQRWGLGGGGEVRLGWSAGGSDGLPKMVVAASLGDGVLALRPELNTMLDKVVTSYKDILFVKETKDFPQCRFSNTVVPILKAWPTFLQLYIDEEFFGGCDITVVWFDASAGVCESSSDAYFCAIRRIVEDTVDKLVPFKDKLDLYRLKLTDLLANVEADVPILMYESKKYTFFSMLGVTEPARVDIQVPIQNKCTGSHSRWKNADELIQIEAPASKKRRTYFVCGKAEGHNSKTCPYKDSINAATKDQLATPVLQMLITKSDSIADYGFIVFVTLNRGGGCSDSGDDDDDGE
ncbi:FAR1 DNA binding domain, zinc finger, SWIM-type, MULE transposase domain containing protein [Tanacetum coccineum]